MQLCVPQLSVEQLFGTAVLPPPHPDFRKNTEIISEEEEVSTE